MQLLLKTTKTQIILSWVKEELVKGFLQHLMQPVQGLLR
jgi:hypothetical protein